MDASKELLSLLEKEDCNYDICRQLIKQIGGCTKIIEDKYGLKTTPLHEAIEHRHYEFAIELIKAGDADFDVEPDGWGPVIWNLQYLDSETEKEQWEESSYKLRLLIALINAGANPNPKSDGEELIHYIRFKIGEADGTHPERHHLWEMEHIVDAYAYGETERFVKKLAEQSVSRIMISDWGFYLLDDNLCDCDHAIFVFEDGERMSLSSYRVGDDEENFYAVSLREDLTLNSTKYHDVLPSSGNIKFISMYGDKECPTLHWLDLSIDDAILRIHAGEPDITVGIVGREDFDYDRRKRHNLFDDK